jgi:ABC-2 type transport system permease protein
MTATRPRSSQAPSSEAPVTKASPSEARGVWRAYRAERRKLTSQLATRVLALICLLGPFAFAVILQAQSASPADTLFGVWAHSSGFAVSLVGLGFAAQWGFPVIAGVLAGDMFSSEDRYGTWKMVLTRSCGRMEVFAGKVLAAATFSLAMLVITAVSSLLAGLLLVGDQPLVGLGGTLLPAGSCIWLVAVSWLVCALPMLAFTSMAVLFSVAARNGIIGVMGPSLVGLVMQLLALVGTGAWVHLLLVGSAFNSWNGLFTVHPFYGPLVVSMIVSILWTAGCLTASWLILRRRDFAGTPVARRAGWVMPVRVVIASVAAIAVVAVATNWGPVAVTPARLKASITPAFDNLTLLQQRELGRSVPPGSKLNVLSSCNRRSGQNKGPGDDWVCTLNVLIPQQTGALPFQLTPVSYDVSVKSDGCYKADAPPSFVGQQMMRVPSGRTAVNPLFTIYGCFNTL